MRLVRTLYRLALRLFPPGFRSEWSESMEEDARRLLEDARRNGRSRLRVSFRLAADLAQALPREWAYVRSRSRSMRGSTGTRAVLGGVRQDARAALRALVRRPRLTAGIVLLLGVGLAACAAVTAVVSAYVLRPLPFPAPDRLVLVSPLLPLNESEVGDLFEAPASWDLDVFTLLDGDAPELVRGAWISPAYPEAFGLRTAAGRLFLPEETQGGGRSVALISHRLWQERYGGDPGVVGRTLTAFTSDRPEDSETFTVVGVLAADVWHYNRYTDFLAPLRTDRTIYGGRLRPDVPPAAAAAALEQRSLARFATVPDDFAVDVELLQDRYTRPLRPVLGVAVATVLLALLIVCGDAAALLLVRAAVREREFTIRRALGAGRGRLVRQLVFEGLALSGAAALLGLLLTHVLLGAGAPALEAHLGQAVPGGLDALRIDARTVAVLVTLTLGTGVFFGLAPLLGALRAQGASALGEGGRGSTRGRARRRPLELLVAGGVALSLTLVVPAGLALRAVEHLRDLELGFAPDRLYNGGVLLRAESYPTSEDRVQFFERLRSTLAALPDVEGVAVGTHLPFQTDFVDRFFESESGTDAASRSVMGELIVHDRHWFDVLGVPLRSGRGFRADDVDGAEPVGVVSRSLAERLWPGQSAIGQRLRVRQTANADEEPGPWVRVVGVSEDLLTSVGGSEGVGLHLPSSQNTSTWGLVALRMRPGAPPPLAEMRRALRTLDPTVSLSETGWLHDLVDAASRPARFLAGLLGVFAAFAIAVALLGLYAVLSFAAAQRRRDVAIRMAVGAREQQVTRLFLRDGMILVATGLLVGCVGALALSAGIEGQLHGVGGTDPTVFGASLVLLLLVAGLAVWIPARRAARTDPMTVLREE
ncbi:MAG: ABC transporter permease [Gemmatimonadota bacterium]